MSLAEGAACVKAQRQEEKGARCSGLSVGRARAGAGGPQSRWGGHEAWQAEWRRTSDFHPWKVVLAEWRIA